MRDYRIVFDGWQSVANQTILIGILRAVPSTPRGKSYVGTVLANSADECDAALARVTASLRREMESQ